MLGHNKKGFDMKIKEVCILMIFLLLTINNCEKEVETEYEDIFSIYISDSTYNSAITSLNTIPVNDSPFLTIDKITTYNWSIHQITYPSTVWEELKEWGNLLHKIYIVVVNDERIYWGTFMDYVDSGGCQNPVIMLLPRYPDGRNTIPESLTIERAYPGYVGSEDDLDMREDTRIYEVLIDHGKFIE